MPCVPLFNSIHALVSFVIEINKEVTHGSFHRLSTVPLISPTGMVSISLSFVHLPYNVMKWNEEERNGSVKGNETK